MIDTNVALKAYLEEDLSEEAQEVLDAARDGTAVLLAPDLILLEFRHALDKRSRRGELSSAEAQEIWEAFGGYPLSLFEVGPLVPRAAEIVDRTGCTVYDAAFVALAESEGTVLLTADGRLLRALEGTPFASLLRPLAEVGEVLRRPHKSHSGGPGEDPEKLPRRRRGENAAGAPQVYYRRAGALYRQE